MVCSKKDQTDIPIGNHELEFMFPIVPKSCRKLVYKESVKEEIREI